MSRTESDATMLTRVDAGDGVAATGDADVRVDVRQLLSHEDMEDGVRLQRRVWGETYRDSVPASLLKISQKVGGLAAGAFLASGEMVGFVYGLTGVDRTGRVVHWSHMLAVLPAYRNHGVGRRLKVFQREYLRGMGVETMYWTFDPLVARNAHLNLNRLGVRLVEYVQDMYADTGSDLHAFGTDRFIAEWPVTDNHGPHVAQPGASVRADGGTPGGARGEAPIAGGGGASPSNGVHPPVVRVEIPLDAEAMLRDRDPDLKRWRASTRAAFLELMSAGYGITSFMRDGGRAFYVLTHGG